MFKNATDRNLRISTSSPAKEAGVNVGLLLDYEGVAVSDPPNMGAFETEQQ